MRAPRSVSTAACATGASSPPATRSAPRSPSRCPWSRWSRRCGATRRSRRAGPAAAGQHRCSRAASPASPAARGSRSGEQAGALAGDRGAAIVRDHWPFVALPLGFAGAFLAGLAAFLSSLRAPPRARSPPSRPCRRACRCRRRRRARRAAAAAPARRTRRRRAGRARRRARRSCRAGPAAAPSPGAPRSARRRPPCAASPRRRRPGARAPRRRARQLVVVAVEQRDQLAGDPAGAHVGERVERDPADDAVGIAEPRRQRGLDRLVALADLGEHGRAPRCAARRAPTRAGRSPLRPGISPCADVTRSRDGRTAGRPAPPARRSSRCRGAPPRRRTATTRTRRGR